MKDLTGKVAVVTGAGQGIGRALVERFGAEGMKLVVADVRPELVEETTSALTASGFEAIGVVTDVTSLESVEALRDATLDAFGAVHVLCNNAGIGSGSEGAIWEHHLNDWRWSFDVNVFGVVNGIHAFVSTMIEQDTEAHIVNTTSSNGGFTPLASSAIYAATKSSVTTITECLWAQLRGAETKVGVSLLYPSTRTKGLLDTGIWRPGANRPERFDRPGAPPKEGRDGLAAVRERFEKAGMEVTFAPIEEVADLCVEGIRGDIFWVVVPDDAQSAKIRARAESQVARSAPDYLVGTGPMAPSFAGKRS
jgi:NAD(P)-dependent dehydrogenase (short-subunit alcohol dehydrogenase family)